MLPRLAARSMRSGRGASSSARPGTPQFASSRATRSDAQAPRGDGCWVAVNVDGGAKWATGYLGGLRSARRRRERGDALDASLRGRVQLVGGTRARGDELAVCSDGRLAALHVVATRPRQVPAALDIDRSSSATRRGPPDAARHRSMLCGGVAPRRPPIAARGGGQRRALESAPVPPATARTACIASRNSGLILPLARWPESVGAHIVRGGFRGLARPRRNGTTRSAGGAPTAAVASRRRRAHARPWRRTVLAMPRRAIFGHVTAAG